MLRLALVLLAAAIGFVVFAVGGYALIAQFSGNAHDRSVEAAMTGLFVGGPIGAIVGAVVAVRRTRRQENQEAV